MKLPLLDSSVFSPYRKKIENLIDSTKLSLVVIYELTATNIDDSTAQKFERWRISAQKSSRLITPTQTDWLMAAKSVRRLRKLKSIDKNSYCK